MRAAMYHNSSELTRYGVGQDWRIFKSGVAVFSGDFRLMQAWEKRDEPKEIAVPTENSIWLHVGS